MKNRTLSSVLQFSTRLCLILVFSLMCRIASAAENRARQPCKAPACALAGADSLLQAGDTIGAYGILTAFASFDSADGSTATMKTLATLIKPRADRLIAKKALSEEASLRTTIRQGAVAVMPFVNSSAAESLQPLRIGLSEMISTDLAQVERLTVLERARLGALAAEMGLGQSGLLDSQASLRLGNLTGAQWVVSGSFGGDGRTLSVTGAVCPTAGGDSGVPAVSSKGTLEGLFKTEKEFVFLIIKALNIVLTDEERKAVETIPTENVLAYLAYCKGLEAEDRGDFAVTLGCYQDAVRRDPEFEKARSALARTTAALKMLSSRQQKSDKSGQSDLKNTAVFTIGPLQLSAVSRASVASMNGVMAGFMPEKPLVPDGSSVSPAGGSGTAPARQPSESERNSYLDATNTGYNNASSTISARIPIPASINNK